MVDFSRKITILAAPLIERIAAGEVVERPANVVKELVENALDAGATRVTVKLEGAGKELIEVIDDGHGMGPEDLLLSVQRHATSKIRSIEDLERIRTLGFRGEALPSIAAISELTLTSRPREALDRSTAFELADASRPKALPVTQGTFLGSAHGTRARVRGLFSRFPARLKFLRSGAAEVSQVREWLERLASCHPAVGFRLISDDRVALEFRPESEAERMLQALGGDSGSTLITASNDVSDPSMQALLAIGLQLRAYWIQGSSLPHARKIVQVVNRRAVRDRLLSEALLAPFRHILLPRQFPAVALAMEIDPDRIDVNVHPMKTELRFLDGGKAFHAVEALVRGMIRRHGTPGVVAAKPEKASKNLERQRRPAPRSEGAPPPLGSAKYLGSAFHTYLVYELDDELCLVDQHAAHERIRFEKLRRRAMSPIGEGATRLTAPEVVPFDPELHARVERRLGWVRPLGFEAEILTEGVAAFRGVPPEWAGDSLNIRLKNLLERLASLPTRQDSPSSELELAPELEMDEVLFRNLASEACHSSVRAGDALEGSEARDLIEALLRCDHPWNCPHGRPTVVRLGRGRLEEWFQR